MEDMHVHQHAKEEPNQFRDSTVISTDVHTCSPPYTNSIFTINLSISYLNIYIYMYTYLDLYIRVNENSLQSTDIILTH